VHNDYSELDVLFDLGLTLKQARVYLGLSQFGILKISEIARISNVARPDLYKTLSNLQKLGLVKKIIQTPIAYGAIPIEDGISLLLGKKREKYKMLKSRTQILLKKTKNSNNTNLQPENQFILYPDSIALKRIDTAIQNAEHSISFCLSWKMFALLATKNFSGILKKISKENVENRFLIENPMESVTAKQLIKHYKKKVSCQIKIASDLAKSNFLIFDKTEIFMMTNEQNNHRKIPALWSNNPSLVSLSNKYFDMMWQATPTV
jgi:sugar-specific transcriptional regulator TrmB